MLFTRAILAAIGILGAAVQAAPIPRDEGKLEARGPRDSFRAPHHGMYTLTSGLPADIGGFNRLYLSFWTTTGLHGAAAEWAALSAGERNAKLAQYHEQGVAVMLAAFGANDLPTAQDPGAIAGQIADYVKTYGLDGVDIDYEDTQALYGGTGAGWVSQLTGALRAQLPDKLISHAPQTPYFNIGGGYDAVHKTIGNEIDYYNVQFYNQGGDEGCSGSLARLNQILGLGVPADKVVLGKPLTPVDASTGFMTGGELGACLQNKPAGWNTQIMFWQWHDGGAQVFEAAVNGKGGGDVPPPPPPPTSNGPPPPPPTAWTPPPNVGTPTTSVPYWQTARW